MKDPRLGVFDSEDSEEQKKFDEEIKQRDGLFHCFGNEVVMVEGVNFSQTVAIVEEVGTGNVFQIAPSNIQFKN